MKIGIEYNDDNGCNVLAIEWDSGQKQFIYAGHDCGTNSTDGDWASAIKAIARAYNEGKESVLKSDAFHVMEGANV